MTRPPPGTPPSDEPEPKGGRAAERLKEFERDRKPQSEPASPAPPQAPRHPPLKEKK